MNSRLCLRFTLLLLCAFLFITHPVKCDGDAAEEDSILQGINLYRVSLNLTALTKNDNAKCLANEYAKLWKSVSCTNSTGANETGPQLPNYNDFLTKCHLNISITADGSIIPVCAQNLDANRTLSNFIKSPYSDDFTNTLYTGVGIAIEDKWAVAVLTTNTPAGSFVTAQDPSANKANSVSRIGAASFCLFLLMGLHLVL